MDFAWSKMPLKMLLILILAFAVNFGLILGIQALFSYRTTGPVDEATLAQLDQQYDGCTILSHKELTFDKLHIYLAEKPDGSIHFVTFREHYLLNRYKLIKGGCKPWPGGEDIVSLKAGTKRVQVSVKEHVPTGVYVIQVEGQSGGQGAYGQFKDQILFSMVGLCALELAAWCLIFRKEEIA